MKKVIKASLVVVGLYGSIITVVVVLPVPTVVKAVFVVVGLLSTAFSLTTNK